ncbi:MAG: BON domain-containing protein [Gammaproteobacteria bacterium]|nr:BON domain-containing protein [Gammaproteobacteria bacterium]
MLTGKQKKLVPVLMMIGAMGALPASLVHAENPSRKVDSTTQQMKQTFSDGVKQGKLETAYLFSEHLNAFDIDTEVTGNRAVLTGEVASEVEKELAGEIAKGVEGIVDVENHLVVNERVERRNAASEQSLRSWVRDSTITAMVKKDLLANDQVAGLLISVTTKNGVVTLSGSVKSDVAKDLAEQIARNADDVAGVLNKLQVSES